MVMCIHGGHITFQPQRNYIYIICVHLCPVYCVHICMCVYTCVCMYVCRVVLCVHVCICIHCISLYIYTLLNLGTFLDLVLHRWRKQGASEACAPLPLQSHAYRYCITDFTGFSV